MKQFIQSKNFGYWALAGVLIVNLFQSAYTELAHDEAYYWMYSNYLDFGFFDHPPMIALMIKLGYSVFQNELGVRLATVLMGAGTILICYEILERRHLLVLTLLFMAIPIVQVAGFIAVPDSPLMFFASLFFLSYKKYLNEKSLLNGLFLALAISAMLYSKYHGLLLVVFCLLANPRLLKEWGTYIIGAVVLIMFSPHIYWQVINDFPSIQYHLMDRSIGSYDISFTLEYLLGQLIVLGPLTLIPMLMMAWRKGHSDNQFTKALRYNLLGILLFFFVSSFKGRVEANWTSVAAIPLVLIVLQQPFREAKQWTWISRLTVASIVLMLAGRIQLAHSFLPDALNEKSEFSGWDDWADEIAELANGRPVVFGNSYQKAAKYSFYTGNHAVSHNSFYYRRNQYDFWPIADSIQGSDVLWIANWDFDWIDRVPSAKGTIRYGYLENYRTFERIQIKARFIDDVLFSSDSANLKVTLFNNYDMPKFNLNPDGITHLAIEVFQGNQARGLIYDSPLDAHYIEDSLTLELAVRLPDVPGDYNFRVGLHSGKPPPNMNSGSVLIEVLE